MNKLLIVIIVFLIALGAIYNEWPTNKILDELEEKISPLPDPSVSPLGKGRKSEISPPLQGGANGEVNNQLQSIQDALNAIEMSIKTITPEPEEAVQPKTRLPQEELRGIADKTIVNLLCKEKDGSTSLGTGALIHQDGIILTNAHIVDNLGEEQECTVRKGSPASPFAIANVLFVSEHFTATTSVLAQIPWDVALLKITKPSGATPLPETFPAIDFDATHLPFINEVLSTFSYPAELLGQETILKSLYLVFSETTVEDFDDRFIQSLAGLGSQQGSSGGALMDPTSGNFVGLIFAIDKETEINKRRLFSLHTARIDKIMREETGKTLNEYLATQP